MPTHRINVRVEKDSIHVDPESLTMTTRDEVHWTGMNAHRFAIEFDSATAFGRRVIPHDDAVRMHVPARTGRYKYTVVSEADPGLRLDPVIVVEEPPTGSNP